MNDLSDKKHPFPLTLSILLTVFLFVFIESGIFAEVSFFNPDLNSKDGLIFSAVHTIPGENSYSTLFSVNLEAIKTTTDEKTPFSTLQPKILTCYPEKMQILQQGTVLQIQNRYGTARYYKNSNELIWISGSQTSVISSDGSDFIPVTPVHHEPVSISPNGKMTSLIKRTSAASGTLIIRDNSTFAEAVLAPTAEFSLEKVPVLWSPDSTYIVYEKEGILYFASTSSVFSSLQVSENYRKIGPGHISNAYWASDKMLVYIENDLVYTIGANEMYTRALYSNLVGIGKIAGRLPYSFSDNRDRFWTNSDCTSIILLQDNKTIWYMDLTGTDNNFVQTLFSYPFVNVPGSAFTFDVFWTPKTSGTELPIVWVQLLRDGKSECYVYKLKYDEEKASCYFTALPLSVTVSKPSLSPDGTMLAFTGEKGMYIYDIARWKQLYSINDEQIVSYVWADSQNLYVGGNETVRYWPLSSTKPEVIFLSSSGKYAWNAIDNTVIAETQSGFYSYSSEKNTWSASKNVITRKALTQNAYWRVFIGTSENRYFSNSAYVRLLSGTAVTKPIYPETANNPVARPKIAITFDALDNSDGLTEILGILSKYGIKSTFFINGEFLRRYNSSVQQIIKNGHECASMFYTSADLTSPDFVVDEDFIRRGLARNEDEFYVATGKELALYWHTPDYKITETIRKAGALAGYSFVNRGLAPADYISLESAVSGKYKYLSASELIEALVPQLKTGAIIPIATGISNGTRTDYLYEKLDILIYNILLAGYDIVPISSLK